VFEMVDVARKVLMCECRLWMWVIHSGVMMNGY